MPNFLTLHAIENRTIEETTTVLFERPGVKLAHVRLKSTDTRGSFSPFWQTSMRLRQSHDTIILYHICNILCGLTQKWSIILPLKVQQS